MPTAQEIGFARPVIEIELRCPMSWISEKCYIETLHED